ncbi:hypothetical protein, partial [Undibacterium sp. 10I3]
MRTLFLNEVCTVSGGETQTVVIQGQGTGLVKAIDPMMFTGNACYASDSYASGPSATAPQRPEELPLGRVPGAGFTGVAIRVIVG